MVECRDTGLWQDATACGDEEAGAWTTASACEAENAGVWSGEACSPFSELPTDTPWCPEPVTATSCFVSDPCTEDYPQIGDSCCDSACTLTDADFSCQYVSNAALGTTYNQSVQVGTTEASCLGLTNGDQIENDGFIAASPALSDIAQGRLSSLFFPNNTSFRFAGDIAGVNHELVADYFDYDSGLDEVYWTDVKVEHIDVDGNRLATPTTERRPVWSKGFRRLSTTFCTHEFGGDVRNAANASPWTVYLGWRQTTRVNGNTGPVEERLRVQTRVFFTVDETRTAPLNWDDCTLNLNGHTDPTTYEFDGLVTSMDGFSFFVFWSVYGTTYSTNWSRCQVHATDANNITIEILDEGTIENFTVTNDFYSIAAHISNPIITAQAQFAANNQECWRGTSQQSSSLYVIDDSKVFQLLCTNVPSGLSANCTNEPAKKYTHEMSCEFPHDGGSIARTWGALHRRLKDVLA